MFYNIIPWCQCHKTFFGVNYANIGQGYADSGVNYAQKWFVTFAAGGRISARATDVG